MGGWFRNRCAVAALLLMDVSELPPSRRGSLAKLQRGNLLAILSLGTWHWPDSRVAAARTRHEKHSTNGMDRFLNSATNLASPVDAPIALRFHTGRFWRRVCDPDR